MRVLFLTDTGAKLNDEKKFPFFLKMLDLKSSLNLVSLERDA